MPKSENLSRPFVAVILTIAVLLTYFSTLNNYFLDDEYTTLIIPFSGLNKSILQFIKYRPVTFIPNIIPCFFFAFMAKFFGFVPFYHHLALLILHITAAYLLFVYIQEISKSWGLAFWTSIFFAINPVCSETVARIINMQYVLCLVFFLSSLILFSSNGYLAQILSFLFFVLSLMSKETGLILPVILLLQHIFFIGYTPIAFLKKKKIYLGFLAIFIIYLALKISYPVKFGSFGILLDGKAAYVWFIERHGFVTAIGTYIINLFTVPFKYLVFPINKFIFAQHIKIIENVFLIIVILPLLVYIILYRQRILSDKITIFGLLWIIFGSAIFTPILDTIDYNNGGLINTRYLYFSSIGLALVVARMFLQICAYNRNFFAISKALTFIILAVFSLVLYGNNHAYVSAAQVARQIPLQIKNTFPLFKGNNTKFFFLNLDDELYYEKGVHLFKNGGLDGAFLLVYGFKPQIFVVDKKEAEERWEKYIEKDNGYLLSGIDLDKALSEGYVLRWDKVTSKVVDASDYCNR